MITTPAKNVYVMQVFKVSDMTGIANILRIAPLEYVHTVSSW